MNTIIYYRSTIDYLGVFKTKYDIELNIASEYFNTTRSRIGCNNSLVIGRYSVRPFYKELENDLELIGSKLINSFSQHHFIANFNWYTYVSEYTPKTYFNLEDVPKNEDMSFVLKGRCNSKKQEWNTKMFAKGYINASNLYVDLNKDSMLGEQGIIIREYVPLKTLEIGLNGQRFTNEWRFFFYKENLLTNFYYWSGVTEKRGVLTEEGIQFAKNISSILSEFINFFVIDIAEKEDGGWILIEVNDAQMSGINTDEKLFHELYNNLLLSLDQNEISSYNTCIKNESVK